MKLKGIELKSNGNYEINQLTAEAMHYAKVERDSLLKEVKELRAEKIKLEKEKQDLITYSLSKIEELTLQLQRQDEVVQTIDQNNVEIISIWKNIKTKSKLSVFSQINVQETRNLYFGANLLIPISLRSNVVSTVLFSNSGKPIYLTGASISIF